MTPTHVPTCRGCGNNPEPWHIQCEDCGSQLRGTVAEASPLEAADIPTAEMVRREQPLAAPTSCLECGGQVDADRYCEQCGALAPLPRDHFRESPADWVGGVCDRGRRHHRNEDAMATWAGPEPDSGAVLVVCDGVSSSQDSDVASLAAARAARDVLEELPTGLGVAGSLQSAMVRDLVASVRAANDAVADSTDPASQNAASCTFAAAVVRGRTVAYANIGDSRVYWLPDEGEPRQLSVDDSVAQLQIDSGVPREQAETGPHAHAITRWLGRDAPDLDPTTGVLEVPGDGWLLVCSDGLWNYASEPAQVETVVAQALVADPAATDPTQLAAALVGWANAQGGRDNITVTLARFGSLERYRELHDGSAG